MNNGFNDSSVHLTTVAKIMVKSDQLCDQFILHPLQLSIILGKLHYSYLYISLSMWSWNYLNFNPSFILDQCVIYISLYNNFKLFS